MFMDSEVIWIDLHASFIGFQWSLPAVAAAAALEDGLADSQWAYAGAFQGYAGLGLYGNGQGGAENRRSGASGGRFGPDFGGLSMLLGLFPPFGRVSGTGEAWERLSEDIWELYEASFLSSTWMI